MQPDMFKRGALRLRCSASILLSYEFEAITVLSHSPIDDVTSSDSNIFYSRDGLFLQHWFICYHYYKHFQFQTEFPVQRRPEVPSIIGSRPRYRIGDWLNLNCSTSNDFSLKWYINGNDVSAFCVTTFVTGLQMLTISFKIVTGWEGEAN